MNDFENMMKQNYMEKKTFIVCCKMNILVIKIMSMLKSLE